MKLSETSIARLLYQKFISIYESIPGTFFDELLFIQISTENATGFIEIRVAWGIGD